MYKSKQGQQTISAWVDGRLKQHHLDGYSVQTPEGETFVVTAGDPQQPALVLLPGTNFNSLSWAEFIHPLSQSFFVVAPDLIGQPGKSAAFRPKFRTQAYGQWLLHLLSTLNIDKAHLMGHSLGGWIALQAAIVAPERVDRLVLVSPAGIIGLNLLNLKMMARSIAFLLRPSHKTSAGMLELMSTRSLDPDTVEWMSLVGQHVSSSLAPPALPAAGLAKLDHSVLLISGERDVFLPASKLAQKAAERLRHVQVEIVPGAGHLLPHEQPDYLTQQVREFLANDVTGSE